MADQSKSGYLILADISGYTSFLAKVELEHAHEILTDLLEVIVENFQSMLTISKLEGDAVFAYVDQERIKRGEILLELIESTYVAFRQRRDTSNRATTCSCRACQFMPSLELKFFVHCGSYVVQNVAGIRELVGSDINLVHRLMKNHITEHTGWNAYSMFSKYAMECLELTIEDVHDQIETYEHLGDIETVTINLTPRYDALVKERLHYISKEEADAVVSQTFEINHVELWQILTSTVILTQMMTDTKWTIAKLTGGRTDVGATNHCLHGKGMMRFTIVDWHPFTYFTGHCVDGKQRFYQMYELIPLPDNSGTTLVWYWKSDIGLPRLLSKLMGATFGQMMGRSFCKMVESYLATVQRPTFQPETQ